jgi:hypothetical protein
VVSDEVRDSVAKIIADRIGNGMREKYYPQADAIIEAVAPLLRAPAVEVTAETPEAAVAKWNRRAHLAQPAQAVDVGAIQDVVTLLRSHAKKNTHHDAVLAHQLERALSGEKAGPVGDGWKLVPVEPTEAMKIAALKELNPLGQLVDWQDCESAGREDVTECYRAMLAASTTPDKEGE